MSERARRVLWPVAVCVVTAGYSLIPLLGNTSFYARGDTPTQFTPTWFHLGALVRGGTWPTWLDPGAWAGGNYAAEALYGIYNPVNVLVWLFVSGASDLLVAMFLVKAAVLVLLALGTYLVCREYGAARWASATMATALPFSGFTLYWDAVSWVGGLMAFAYVPWVWWAFRKVLRGDLNPFWAFVIGALAVTQGNPYGSLGVVVVGVAVVTDGLVAREWAGTLRVVLLGTCVAAFLPLVYLPLLETSHLGYRFGGPLLDNNGHLAPDAGDLLGISAPTYVPSITVFGARMQVPSTYFCWFVLPLLPWFRLDVLRRRVAGLAGVWVLGAAYLLLSLGPSKLWMFRWPLRHVEYLYLAVAVLVAVVLSAGLHRERWRSRLLTSLGLLALTGWLTLAEFPNWHQVSLGGPALTLLLTLAVLLWHRFAPGGTAWLTVPLVLGSAVVLVFQSVVFPVNVNLRGWFFPHDVAQLRSGFADRDGLVIQFAGALQNAGNRKGVDPWSSYLGGSMYAVAGVDAVNSYWGMGYAAFTKQLCLRYNGFTRPCGYDRLWQPLATGEPSLADLMKVETVVVQPRLARGVLPPSGWAVDKEPRVVTVRRTEPLPYPQSRLSWASPGVQVRGAATVDAYRERVSVTGTGQGGRLVFGMLAWPGYRATLDGRPVEVGHDEAGLLTVALPPGTSGTVDLRFRPPGLTVGLAAAGAGALGAVALGLLGWRRRRRITP